MNWGTELIREIESELAFEYLPGAIKWSDDNYDNAWSNAIDRFDKVLSVAIETNNHSLSKQESEFYKATILDLISKYNQFKKINETEMFLKSIGRDWSKGK